MFARIAIAIASTIVITTTAQPAHAQAPSEGPKWEFLVSNGKLVPTGVQRDQLDRGNMTAVQIGYVATPRLVVTGTAGWGRTRTTAVGTPKLDVFTYDVGAELRAQKSAIATWLSWKPFAGIGAGGRSYNYRHLTVDATHNLAAYFSLGAEFGIRWGSLRIEARDYVAGFKPLEGGPGSATRNDVVVMTGFRFGR